MYNITFGKSRLVAHNKETGEYLFLAYSDMVSARKVKEYPDYKVRFKDNTTLQLMKMDFDILMSSLLEKETIHNDLIIS